MPTCSQYTYNELEAFVEDLGENHFKYSVICLEETWLTETDYLYHLIPPVVTVYHRANNAV